MAEVVQVPTMAEAEAEVMQAILSTGQVGEHRISPLAHGQMHGILNIPDLLLQHPVVEEKVDIPFHHQTKMHFLPERQIRTGVAMQEEITAEEEQDP